VINIFDVILAFFGVIYMVYVDKTNDVKVDHNVPRHWNGRQKMPFLMCRITQNN